MISANLIPSDRLIRQRRRSRLRQWAAICSAYASVLIVASAVGYAAFGRHDIALGNRLEATDKSVRESARMITGLRTDLARARVALETAKAVGTQPDWSSLFLLLGRKLGDDVVLDRCELTCLAESDDGSANRPTGPQAPQSQVVPVTRRRFRVSLTGFGKSQSAVSQFVLRLERVDVFDEVRLMKSNRQAFLAGEAVAFEIECSI